MDDLDPEQAAHIAPGGPALAAASWFSAIVDRADLEAAWDLTSEPLRLALVQSWLMETGMADPETRDDLALNLAEGSGDGHWADFASWRLHRWQEGTFRRFVDEGWGLLTVPELAGPDLELVRVAPGREGRELEVGEPMLVQTLTVRLVDQRWLLAGVGRRVAVPGWPPTDEEIPSDFS